jgi:hypothetical protein
VDEGVEACPPGAEDIAQVDDEWECLRPRRVTHCYAHTWRMLQVKTLNRPPLSLLASSLHLRFAVELGTVGRM